jgi:hypothetical protein
MYIFSVETVSLNKQNRLITRVPLSADGFTVASSVSAQVSCFAIRKGNLIQNLLVKAFRRNELVSSDLSDVRWKKLDSCWLLSTFHSPFQSCIHGWVWMESVRQSVPTAAIELVTKILFEDWNSEEKLTNAVGVSRTSVHNSLVQHL